MKNCNQNNIKVVMTKKDIIIANLNNTDYAVICTPCECMSGVTVNFISLREFEKKRLNNKNYEMFNILNYTIDENNFLTINSELSTHGLDTIVYCATYANKTMPSWKVVENDNTLEK